MLLLLILIAALVVFLDLAGSETETAEAGRFLLRKAFLKTAVLLGITIAISSEILGLFHVLTRWGAAAVWLLVILAAGWRGLRKGHLRAGMGRISRSFRQIQRFELAVGLGLGLMVVLLFVIIVYAPVNNSDSLQYHMSRVMHWAQDQSLDHYATGFTPQLVNPIWAEEAILNVRLLWGDDRFAELVQFAAMLVSLVGVSLLAGLLGANRIGQIAAVFFTASIPMGIMQATSTQNDYAAAVWLICALCFVAISAHDLRWRNVFYVAGSLGLGLLTKGTFYPYAVPVGLWFAYLQLRRCGLARTVKAGFLLAGIVVVLNLGYWARNLSTYGGPLGPSQFVGAMASQKITPGFVAASVVRNVVMNFVTPSETLNEKIVSGLTAVFGRFEPLLQDFHLLWGWNHEDRAANPLHILLVLLSLIVLIVLRRRVKDGLVWGAVLAVLGVWVMLSTVIRIDPFGIRYQLPFMVAWAPLIGVALTLLDRPRVTRTIVVILLIAMIPWVVYNRTRSLIALQDTPGPFTIPCSWHLGCGVKSVLVEPPSTFLFINIIDLKDPYLEMAQTIKSNRCADIGLAIDSWDSEYVFWWILDAPQSGRRIETIATYSELEKYLDPNFHPCAVICKTCSRRPVFHGLPMKSDYHGATLYMGDTYTFQP